MNRRGFIRRIRDAAIGTAVVGLPFVAHSSGDFSQYPLAAGEEQYVGLPEHIVENYYDGDIDSRSIVRVRGNSFERFQRDHSEYQTLDDVRALEALRPEDAPYVIFIKHRTIPLKLRDFGIRSQKPHEWFQKDPDPGFGGFGISLERQMTHDKYEGSFHKLWSSVASQYDVGMLDRDPNPTDNLIICDNDTVYWTQINYETLEKIPPGPIRLKMRVMNNGPAYPIPTTPSPEHIDLMMENTSGCYNALGLDGAVFPDMEPFTVNLDSLAEYYHIKPDEGQTLAYIFRVNPVRIDKGEYTARIRIEGEGPEFKIIPEEPGDVPYEVQFIVGPYSGSHYYGKFSIAQQVQESIAEKPVSQNSE